MSQVTEQQVLDALGRVTDPDSGRDVVQLGMISGLVVKQGNIGFAVEVDPAEGAKKEPLRKACEQAVHQLPGVTSVTAVLTAHRQAPGDRPAAPPPGAPPRATPGAPPP
ncbi:MAG: iron-sulfur cluster assembly protein, partial [Minwuiales bacterium]|nr:iron-sulfur cluster assembly protein [Minwuiales bacterium]